MSMSNKLLTVILSISDTCVFSSNNVEINSSIASERLVVDLYFMNINGSLFSSLVIRYQERRLALRLSRNLAKTEFSKIYL